MVADELARRLGRAVTVENDINLAALGEQWRGVATGVGDFAFLSIGTGLGSGLVLGGELHRGHHGGAGEVDFASGAGLGSPIDPCASAVSALAEQLTLEASSPTILMAPFDVRSIFDAARAGDELALRVVAEEARRIALHISPIAAVVDVAMVVLGGGVGINGDLLLPPVAHSSRASCPTRRPRGVPPRRRGGADGRTRGRAARRARQRVRPTHQLALIGLEAPVERRTDRRERCDGESRSQSVAVSEPVPSVCTNASGQLA